MGFFSAAGVGPIKRIEGIMNAPMYKEILENTMLPYAEEEMPLLWTFQHDNDPKHTSCLVKSWLKDQKINVMKWPAQSPDLNPIENLWQIVKQQLRPNIYRPKEELYRAIESEWKRIPTRTITNLIDSMTKRWAEVIKNKGYSTKY